MQTVTYDRGNGGFTLNQEQLEQLRVVFETQQDSFDLHASAEGLGVPIYEMLLEFISDWVVVGTTPAQGIPGHSIPGEPVWGYVAKPSIDPAVWRWIDGAISVNSGNGFFADFIREYTKIQFELRGGDPSLAENFNQEASNRIALRLAQDILVHQGALPGVLGLGAIDAGAAASTVFGKLPLGNNDYAPWAGSLLFPYLGSDNFFKDLILNSEQVKANIGFDSINPETLVIKYNEGTYDLIAMLQAAQKAGLEAGFENIVEAVLNLIYPEGIIDRDQENLIVLTNNFFADYYHIAQGIFTPGNDLVFNRFQSAWNNLLPDTNYQIDTYDDDALVTEDPEKIVVMNGGRGNDDLTGGKKDDLIDGDDGQDTIHGGEGNDYLFGGKEDDELHGDVGHDYLYGNKGNDTLIGGEGSDHLEGGEGNDIYQFDGGFGIDKILDSDDSGSIVVNGLTVGNVKGIEGTENIFTLDNKVDVVQFSDGTATNLLISTRPSSGSTGGTVLIKNWQEGNLGINLLDPEETVIDNATTGTFNGDTHDNVITIRDFKDTLADEVDGDPYINLISDGGAGNDFLMGALNGSDTLRGGADNDFIIGGNKLLGSDDTELHMLDYLDVQGSDQLYGDAGSDYIVVSGKNSVAHGGTENDFIRADQYLWAEFRPFEADGGVSADDEYDVSENQVWSDFSKFLQPHYVLSPTNGLEFIEYNLGLTSPNWSAPNTSVSGLTYFYLQRERPSIGLVMTTHYGDTAPNFSTTVHGNWAIQGSFQVSWESRMYTSSETIPIANYQDMKGHNLYGDEGDDVVWGGIMSDYISGGEGKDSLLGLDGHDIIDGGSEVDEIRGGTGNDILIGGAGKDVIYGNGVQLSSSQLNLPDDDVIYGGDNEDDIDGGDGNDYLDGGTGEDTLRGGDGDDYVFGGDDTVKDILSGGKGNDTIVVGKLDHVAGDDGDDIYIWDPHQVASSSALAQTATVTADGASSNSSLADITIANASLLPTEDTYIIDDEGNNTLALVGEQDFTNFAIDKSATHLLLNMGNNQQIILQDALTHAAINIVTGSSVEELASGKVYIKAITDDTFLNGTDLLTQQQISTTALMLNNLQRAVTVTAAVSNSYLAGGLVDDTLTAHVGGSRFIGGKGNDTYIGDVGDDTYLVRQGDGHDVITDLGGNNTLKLDKNIAVNQLRVNRVGTDLLIKISEEQTITVKNMFDAATGALILENAVQNINFYDGTAWNIDSIKQQALTGSVGDDVIGGFETDDVVVGGKGNDQLSDQVGNDVYQYTLGDGNDVIADASGTDRIELSGILPEQVIAFRDAYNNLVLKFANGEKITVAGAFDALGNFTAQAIETIKFSYTSTWDTSRILQEVAEYTPQHINGTDGADVLLGDAASDILTGAKGNDRILGDAGDDTYRYTLGDGKDVIVDVAGVDRIELGGITQDQLIARSNGRDLVLSFTDGGSLTVTDMFVSKSQTPVDPLITQIVQELQTNWIAQAEALIEEHYGLVGDGEITLNFERNGTVGVNRAHIQVVQAGDANTPTRLILEINLDAFAAMPTGSGPWYYDRTIAHEMVHAVMASNMSIAGMPGWFLEGTAELIHGADERVVNEIGIISNQTNFNLLFKTTVGSPTTNAGYAVSYIAVKLLDQEIRDNGGIGIKELFDELQTGKTLDQALAAVSLAHNGMNGQWNNLASFETHFRAVGFTSMDALLNLSNADTGSIAGSDYGNAALDANSVLSNIHIGSSTNFTIVIPDEYINSVGVHNEIESIKFADGSIWNTEQIQQAITQGNLIGTDGDDVITGTNGNDNLRGYKGTDEINGGLGNDVYSYTLGDGKDFIVDTAGVNELHLSGVAGNQVKTTRDINNNLVFTFSDGGTVTVSDAFYTNGNLKADRITTVRFADGSVWDLARIKQESTRVQGSVLTAPARGNLFGTNNDDTLIAGINNTLQGGFGNDTYVINTGGELHIIKDNYGANTLQFGAGVTKEQITFSRGWYGTSLQIHLNDMDMDSGHISVRNVFAGIYTTGPDANNYPTPAIEYVRFANGEQLSLQDIKRELLISTDGDDDIYGYETNDSLAGEAGNDYLNGLSGDDKLFGGAGNDGLRGDEGNDVLDSGSGDYDVSHGGGGDDIFIYNEGSGYDVIEDDSGFDILQFGAGITKEQITFSGEYSSNSDNYYRYNLMIKIDALDTIEIDEMFVFDKDELPIVERSSIDLIRFSNGDELSLSDLKNILLTPTAGDDYLTGFLSDNSFDGGAGDDLFYDPMGDDSYFYELGDGNDVIYDEGGDDVIEFGAGILRSDLSFFREGIFGENLVVSLGNGNCIDIGDIFYNSSVLEVNPDFVIESFKFADGFQMSFTQVLEEMIETPVKITANFDATGRMISGIAVAGNTITVKDRTGTVLASTTVDSLTGEYSITLVPGLFNSEIVTVTATDVTGKITRETETTAPDRIAPLQPTAMFDSLGAVISGVAEPGSRVYVEISWGALLGQTTADATTGAYSITLETPLINKETVYIETVDAAGNTSWTVFLNAPDLSAPDLIAPPQPSAIFNSLGTVVSGVAEAGSTVVVKNTSGTTLGSIVANVTTGAYSITLPVALINKETVNITATDTTGNISVMRAIVAPDLTAPTQPSAAFNSLGAIVSGIAEAGSTVVVKNTSGTTLGSIVANVTTGAYSITLPVALINKETVNITATDAAGNISPVRSIIAPDLTAPIQPSATFNSLGTIVNGVAEAGSTVAVKNTSGTTLGSIVANVTTGAYSITLPVALINKEPVNVTATDAAGNVSPVRAIIAPDLTAPVQPTAAFNSLGTVVSGVAEAGSTVVVKNTSGTTLGSIVANVTTGAYSITLPVALINKETVNVTATDVAGNISVVRAIVAPDLTAPVQPTATFNSLGTVVSGVAEVGSTVVVKNTSGTTLGSIVANVTTGAYSITLPVALINKETVNVTATDTAGNISVVRAIAAPDLTAPTQPSAAFNSLGTIVSGVAEVGSTVVVKNTSGTTLGSIVANVTTGAYSITLPVALINKETVNVTATDVAGNISVVRAIVAPDLTAPTQPSATFNSLGTIVSGVAEAGSTVAVKNTSGATLGSIVANVTTGAYSITLASALINKETVNVAATDVAGNISIVRAIVAPDLTPPSAPTVTFDSATKIISGIAEIGSTVVVKNVSGDVLVSTTANATTGAYSASISQPLTNGQSLFTTAVDNAGNQSTATSTQVIINEQPSMISGLKGSYFGYHQPANGNVDLTNLTQVRGIIANKTPDATFIATTVKYGPVRNGLGMGTNLQTFLSTDAATLNRDPGDTSDAIVLLEGKIQLTAGTYNFRVRADDGYSIRVNGSVVAEYNANQGATTRTHAAFTITNSGSYDIEIVYWDAGYGHELGVEFRNTASSTYTYLGGTIISHSSGVVVGDQTPPPQPTAAFNSLGTVVSGVAEASSTVVIKNGVGNTLGSIVADAVTGAYSITLASALINKETVNITATDAAGNVSPVRSIIAPDLTAPTQPSAAFNSLGTVVSGIAEAGTTVAVKNAGGTTLGSVTADISTGAYSITLTTALINKETVNVTATDVAGNISVVRVIVAPDLTAPIQPTAVFNSLGTIVSGVAEAGSTVAVKNAGGTTLGSVTADISTGAYSITLPVALINKETVNVTATDVAGNISVVRSIVAPDLIAPTQPSAAFNSIGTIVSGVAEAGSTVVVKNGVGNTLGSIVADAVTGAYSITLASALINKETVNITATDAAGNISPVRSIIAPDLTAPTQPSAVFNSLGTIVSGVAEVGSTVVVKNIGGTTLGSVTTDATGAYSITLTVALINKEPVNVTATDVAGNISVVRAIVAPDFTAPTQPSATFNSLGTIVSGVAEAGSTVAVKNTGGTTLGSITADASTGAYSITLATALINKETVNVTATDIAGNISVVRAIVAPDLTAPVQPTATFNSLGTIVSGVAEVGSTVVVKNTGGTTLGSITADASTGAYSITLATALINKETVNVTATDVAGNISVVRVIVAPDLTAPTQPSATFNSLGTTVSGVAEADSTVVVKNGVGNTLGSIVVDAVTGAYSIMLASALINKETVNITATDAAGNISPVRSIIAPDLTAPLQPTAIFNSLGSIVSGVAEAGSTVVVKNTSGTTLGSIVANVTTGAYSITLPVALINKETVNVTATDTAGNISVVRSIVAPDLIAPIQPSAAFNSVGTVVSGIAEAGSTVAVKNTGGTTLGSITADVSTGAYSITLATALINKETVNVTATDVVGNISVARAIVAPDLTPPSAPTVTFDSATKIISGIAEIGSTVVVKNASGDLLVSTTANATTGAYSASISQTLTNGQSLFTTAVDNAGNQSAATSTQVIINEQPSMISGLKGSYFGYHQPANGNVDLTNLTQVRGIIANKTPDATFIATTVKYGPVKNGLGMGTNLQTFLSTDAATLSRDPGDTSDAIVRLEGKIQLTAGTYNFRVRADDGYSIRVNGNVVAEYNGNQGATTRTHVAFTITNSGSYDIEIVYWDAGYGHELGVEFRNTASSTYAYLGGDLLSHETMSAASSSIMLDSSPTASFSTSQMDSLIQAMASFAPPVAAETQPLVGYYDAGQLMFAANV